MAETDNTPLNITEADEDIFEKYADELAAAVFNDKEKEANIQIVTDAYGTDVILSGNENGLFVSIAKLLHIMAKHTGLDTSTIALITAEMADKVREKEAEKGQSSEKQLLPVDETEMLKELENQEFEE